MEKQFGEDEIKGLEEEIDLAVDRLFVERKGEPTESFMMDAPKIESSSEPSYDMTQDISPESILQSSSMSPPVLKSVDKIDTQLFSLDVIQDISPESILQSSSMSPPVLKSVDKMDTQLFSLDVTQDISPESILQSSSMSPPVLKSVDKMEAQLLSLEWEVTKENIEKSKEEVLALRGEVKGETETVEVLNLMEKILNHMLNNEKNIRPPLIKFLLDSKETIKLLMRRETDSDLCIYKQLAYTGIEARFNCMEELDVSQSLSSCLNSDDEMEKKEISLTGKKEIDQMMGQWNRFSEKLDNFSIKMDHPLSLKQIIEKPIEKPIEKRPNSAHITVIKVDGKLFGVESEKVVKLFKVPDTFHDQYGHQQKVRLKGFEVKVVDLNRIFSIQEGDQKRGMKILTVKENGDYKGLMVDEVLKKLSTQQDLIKGEDEYFLGMIHSTYQEQDVEIPILDLNKF